MPLVLNAYFAHYRAHAPQYVDHAQDIRSRRHTLCIMRRTIVIVGKFRVAQTENRPSQQRGSLPDNRSCHWATSGLFGALTKIQKTRSAIRQIPFSCRHSRRQTSRCSAVDRRMPGIMRPTYSMYHTVEINISKIRLTFYGAMSKCDLLRTASLTSCSK